MRNQYKMSDKPDELTWHQKWPGLDPRNSSYILRELARVEAGEPVPHDADEWEPLARRYLAAILAGQPERKTTDGCPCPPELKGGT